MHFTVQYCYCQIVTFKIYGRSIDNFIIVLHVTGHWRPPFKDQMEPRHGIMKAFPKVKRAKVLHGKGAPPAKKKPDECEVTGCHCVCVRVCVCVCMCVREKKYIKLCKRDRLRDKQILTTPK